MDFDGPINDFDINQKSFSVKYEIYALAIYEKKQLSFQLCYLSFTMGLLIPLSI